MFEAGMNQTVRAEGVHLEVGFLPNRLGHSGQMEYVIRVLDRLLQRGGVVTVSVDLLKGKTLKPSRIALLPQKTADLEVPPDEGLHQMASNKTGCSCDQNLQKTYPLWND